jgi:hypothetical protein
MSRRWFLLFLVALLCGCKSDEGFGDRRFRPVDRLINELCSSHCPARMLKPGDQYFDYGHEEGGWYEFGTDGKSHPIPTPPGKPNNPRAANQQVSQQGTTP